MIYLKTRTRWISVDAYEGTTPRHILNAFVELSGLNADEFRIITQGRPVVGADMDRTCIADLCWHTFAAVHLVTSNAAEAFLLEHNIHRIETERPGAGFRP